ncbi:MAG: serine/threonine-protein kinase [Isosphaeraceae bacterium]
MPHAHEARPREESETWVSRQVEALVSAWERGDEHPAAAILARFPEIAAEPAVRLIYEEYCLRREAGLDVDPNALLACYPQWAAEIQAVLSADRLLGPVARFPQVGESVGPFDLLAELGRGASGRTYLATEPALADRPVVIKAMPADQLEHLALARLQHTHIVPLFSEHQVPDRGLRLLCMPYLGGASLSRILDGLASIPHARRSGRAILEQLDRLAASGHGAPAGPKVSPYRRFLESASYSQAVVWMVACIADGLAYAHARSLVHMDIKPSNVLLTAEGQPLLLDFHLARGPLAPGDVVIDVLGGTPGWMSPEQTTAFDAVSAGQPLTQAVDGRSDVYGLGLLLHELLAGPTPAEGTRGSLRGAPGVSRSLADLTARCLEPNPSQRYQDAAFLAEDLRRHLRDLPLRGVSNRSPVETWRKWRRRQPGAMGWAVAGTTAAVTLALVGYALVSGFERRISDARAAVSQGRTAFEISRFDEANALYQHGLDELDSLPGSTVETLRQQLRREQARALRGASAAELHELAERIRFRVADARPDPHDAQAILDQAPALWARRDRLRASSETQLDPVAERRIDDDLLELALVWADLRVRQAEASDRDRAQSEARRLLDEAAQHFGPRYAIALQRQTLSGDVKPAGLDEPKTVAEHYARARFDFRAGRIAEAADHFRVVIDESPHEFWPYFYQGLCAYQLGRFGEAVAAFGTSIALAPRAVPCYYNRGLAHEAQGQLTDAQNDYDRALSLDPALAPARLNRGLLALHAGKFDAARSDLERALRDAADNDTRARVRQAIATLDRPPMQPFGTAN